MNIDPALKSAYLGAFQFIRSGIAGNGFPGLPYFRLLQASVEELGAHAIEAQMVSIVKGITKDIRRELDQSSVAKAPGLLGCTSSDPENISAYMALVDDGERVLNHLVRNNLPDHFSGVFALISDTDDINLLNYAKKLIYTSPYDLDIPLIREIVLGFSEKGEEEIVYRAALPFVMNALPYGGFENMPTLSPDFIETHGLTLSRVIVSSGMNNRTDDPVVWDQRKKYIESLIDQGLPLAYAMKMSSNKVDVSALNNGAGFKSSNFNKNMPALMQSVVTLYRYGTNNRDHEYQGAVSDLNALLITSILRALPDEDRNRVLFMDSIRQKYYEETSDVSILSQFKEKSSLKRILVKDLGM
jgi:hypothetical protein